MEGVELSNALRSLKSEYGSTLSNILRPPRRLPYTALDVYSGAGGLSLGLEAAGFEAIGIDKNHDSCATYNKNLRGECVNDEITPGYEFPKADLLVGGPPCQPFSVRGRQLGAADGRDGIPSFISAVKKTRPRVWVLENVKGVFYRSKEYFDSCMEKLRLLEYDVHVSVINCADYGVPQNRRRVIVVGHRGKGKYTPPSKADAKVSAGDALRNIPKKDREVPSYLTPSMDEYIAMYEKASCCRPRDLDRGKPARTLTCRNLGGQSSDMHRIRTRNGKRRLLYVREAARLQGFPDWFEFTGTRGSQMNQIGNAVPPLFALFLGIQLQECME